MDLAQVRWPTSPRLSLKGVLAADPAHWQNWAEGLIAGEKLNPLEWSEKRRHVSSVYVINKNKTMHEGWWGLPDVFFSKKEKNDHVSNNSSIEPTFWGLIYVKAPENVSSEYSARAWQVLGYYTTDSCVHFCHCSFHWCNAGEDTISKADFIYFCAPNMIINIYIGIWLQLLTPTQFSLG